MVLVEAQLLVSPVEVASPVAGNALVEDEVLRASRPADWVVLNETEPVDDLSKCRFAPQGTAHGKRAKTFKRRAHGTARSQVPPSGVG
jgi:hypothetical protein